MYVAIAYRWGELHNHHFVIGIDKDLVKLSKKASEYAIERGGKYGVAVYDEYHKLRHYSQSGSASDCLGEPYENSRTRYHERLGFRVELACTHGYIDVPEVGTPIMKPFKVEPPKWLLFLAGESKEWK